MGKVENASCMMYCMCHDCHITCLVCQWLQSMKKLCVLGKKTQILDKGKLITIAVKVGKFYYFKCWINGVYSMCDAYAETKVKRVKRREMASKIWTFE